jgi:hypothetical protein
MLSWLKLLLPQKWRHVYTHVVDVRMTLVNQDTGRPRLENGKVLYQCYESNRGNRKVNIAMTAAPLDGTNKAKLIEDYQIKIVPWLGGQYDPDILSYSDVDVKNVERKLAR